MRTDHLELLMAEDKPPKQSEEFIKFKTAMMKIVSVNKSEIVDALPKMFRERKPPTKKRPDQD
jgi:hypothetical protein